MTPARQAPTAEHDPAEEDGGRQRTDDVVGPVRVAHRAGCGRQVLDPYELERQVIDAGMKGTGEESEGRQRPAPHGQDRLRDRDPLRQCGDGRPEHDVAGQEQAVCGEDQRGMVGVRGELVREEEVVPDAQQDPGQHEQRPEHERDAAEPPAGKTRRISGSPQHDRVCTCARSSGWRSWANGCDW
jgi:hypothetical protein